MGGKPKRKRKISQMNRSAIQDKTSNEGGNLKNIKTNEMKQDSLGDEPLSKKIKKKRTNEIFLQDGVCVQAAPSLSKCRECRREITNIQYQTVSSVFCRFYEFRRLKYNENGFMHVAGFGDPEADATKEDIKLWLPNTESPPSDLDVQTARFLLTQVGDHFCDLLVQENGTYEEHMSDNKVVAWKKVVQGVREMCDVCQTTLFNRHWTCMRCGFVVCLDCYKSRKTGLFKTTANKPEDRDEFMWLFCTKRARHKQENLMLTQIIAGDCLNKLGQMVHEMRELWEIKQFCGCPSSKESKVYPVECKESVKLVLSQELNNYIKKEETVSRNNITKDEALDDDSSSEEENNSFALRQFLVSPQQKKNGLATKLSVKSNTDCHNSNGDLTGYDALMNFGLNKPIKKEREETGKEIELKHYIRRNNWQDKGRQQLPIRIMTLTESRILYPNIPHSWLCDGKLLWLSDPICKDNSKLFQDQWKRGQPVLVSNICKMIDKNLWTPEAFARDFGELKNDLINCMTGKLVPNQLMRKFWEGFEEVSRRLKDEQGRPMLLKLKDWPPGEDFAKMLPVQFENLMQVLPLPEYTRRNGKLNLASRLPDIFVRPDLGPKMYNAYGSALYPDKGTTNLHLDISDAVNIMVYVGVPKDSNSSHYIKRAYQVIEEAGCDILTQRRVCNKDELPGALWHIYNARDADKIRDLLHKVTLERGGRLEPHNDPIHDQRDYLDSTLRGRLYKEYGVEGYTIVQCLGDAVFIPAGAPHQVQNLLNCIKVAEDFVSPENVAHCFHLTQEFRGLSDNHTNHEDKLQIKNIIYHVVKDSLSTLGSYVNQHVKREEYNIANTNKNA